MLTTNPYALLADILPAWVMQTYIVVMAVAVLAGTLADLFHKRSAEFFALRRRAAKSAAQRRLGAFEIAGLALRTAASEVAASGEFCEWPRRLSHLLMSYGFVVYLVATVPMAFAYASAERTPICLTAAWNLGALASLAGGTWFFLRLKVNVAHEGHSPFHLIRADLFVGSLIASLACGLLWHFAQTVSNGAIATQVLFALYLFFSALLFCTVPWSKFAHMFYKPAAAFQRRLEEASGASDLPQPADVRHIPR